MDTVSLTCNIILKGPNYEFSNKVDGISYNMFLYKNISVEDEVFLVANYPKEIPLEFLCKINMGESWLQSRFYTYSKISNIIKDQTDKYNELIINMKNVPPDIDYTIKGEPVCQYCNNPRSNHEGYRHPFSYPGCPTRKQVCCKFIIGCTNAIENDSKYKSCEPCRKKDRVTDNMV
jgi:hypothetical protein